MQVKYLQCAKCGRTYPREEIRYRCECGDSIELVYDYSKIKGRISWEMLRSRPFDHWRYREFYPDLDTGSIISMGEGGTPLIRSRNLASELNMGELFFKLESMNPTGSFKDRGSTVEISEAYHYLCHHGECENEIVCASTGNMGASVAAYCARGGIKCTIYVPKDTAKIKLLQMMAHGAEIVRVDGDYTVAMLTAKREYEERGRYLAGDYPYRGEGEKSVGLEIIDQLDGVPDYLVCPIGNGTLVHGIWKGLKELKITGLISRLPKVIGVQAEGCNTVARSFEEGRDDITPVVPHTLMDAVACGDPLDGTWALRAVRESEGWAAAVSDIDGAKARDLLGKKEGIFAELSGALSMAGLIKAYQAEIIEKDARTVVIVTGHGLKEPETFEDEMRKISQIIL
ncbi:threonine synthase [Methanocella sp. MCL-LM]|uniref:threonine synthase n=1 Tax=Methanocella sp. MCL-LM TaxID=3412035 RepID=UPI003C744D1F